MLISVVGLFFSGLIYLLAIYGFLWAGERRVSWGVRHGVAMTFDPKTPSLADIWARHSVFMTGVYGAVFLAMGLMGFALWERVGFGALSALVFGSLWVANSPGPAGLPGISGLRKMGSDVGYWILAVVDWVGYLGVLCFGTAIVIEALSPS
jgi:hypothetical protein